MKQLHQLLRVNLTFQFLKACKYMQKIDFKALKYFRKNDSISKLKDKCLEVSLVFNQAHIEAL